jgi:hypothetical protein
MTEQQRCTEDGRGGAADDRRTDLERTVDELEERVVGQRIDQVRREDDDPTEPAFDQDLGDEPPSSGPASEPS